MNIANLSKAVYKWGIKQSTEKMNETFKLTLFIALDVIFLHPT